MLSPTHIAKYQEYCSQKWHSNQMESYGMLIVIEDISSLQTHRSTLLIRSLRPHSIEYLVGIEEQGKRSNLVFGNRS